MSQICAKCGRPLAETSVGSRCPACKQDLWNTAVKVGGGAVAVVVAALGIAHEYGKPIAKVAGKVGTFVASGGKRWG